MRWIFLGLASVAFLCFNGSARAQTAAPEVELDQFYQQGINLQRKEAIDRAPMPMPKVKGRKPVQNNQYVWSAFVRVDELKKVQALELLTVVKDLDGVNLDITEAKLTKGALERIKALPNVKTLTLSVRQMSDDDLKTLIGLKQLEDLTLVCPELTEAQIRQLKEMEGINNLWLAAVRPNADELNEMLKLALPNANVQFQPMARLPNDYSHLAVGAKEEHLARLKKEKFNAALDALKLIDQRVKLGKITYGDLEFLAIGRNLRDAALDLDDAALRRKIIDDYVDMLAVAILELRHQNEAGKLDPYKYSQARYEYLDAQILQLRLKKQMDKK